MNNSNFSAPSPSFSSPSPVANVTSPVASPSVFSPSPSSFRAFAPSPSTAPSPVQSPSAFAPSPFNATFERFNHSTSVNSLRQTEVNFFLAYVGISFCVVVIFVYYTRQHLYKLLVDSRQYVDVTPGDTELKRVTKYGVLKSSGESKSYGEFAELDELDIEHKSRQVGQGVDI